jgi:hypothetical protein
VTEPAKPIQALQTNAATAGLLFTSSRTFPRSREHVGPLIDALDVWLAKGSPGTAYHRRLAAASLKRVSSVGERKDGYGRGDGGCDPWAPSGDPAPAHTTVRLSSIGEVVTARRHPEVVTRRAALVQ